MKVQVCIKRLFWLQTFMEFFPKFLCILLKDRFLGVEDSNIHLQVCTTWFFSLQDVIELLHLGINQAHVHFSWLKVKAPINRGLHATFKPHLTFFMFENKMAWSSTIFQLYSWDGHWLIDFQQLLQDTNDLLLIPKDKTLSSHSHNHN